ncbi:MAG: DmsE family decaheme c-type cytochrome [Acidobacteria bacterium]|nr:DmsE family decaheme c-type cytochrome [Acidobacteriota bacterium]MBI3422617.1 DmsE family decaheme c-type cytochrome [Acidobacteriota bacterium]
MRVIKLALVLLFSVSIAVPFLSTQLTALSGQKKPANLPFEATVAALPFSTDVSQYVGSASCAECHADQVARFAPTAHHKAQSAKAAVNLRSCEACHGGAKAHVEYYKTTQKLAAEGKDAEAQALMNDESKAKAASMVAFDKLTPAETNTTCMQCHSQMKEHTVWRGSKHEAAKMSCLSCHSMHHAPAVPTSDSKLFATNQAEGKLLKMRTEADTCFQCHGDVRKAQFQRSTHLFRNENREHQQSCSACHEAHGSIGEKMMRTGSINETCYQCHAEKRGPFLYEHSPVREGCTTCHKSHGSNNTALLVARAPMLCQQCHIQGRHQTVAGLPNSAFALNRSCATCHAAIHGSNHPSGINLQR